MPITKYTKK